MTVPHIGVVLKAIRDGQFDQELKYIVQQAYLRREYLTGDEVLSQRPMTEVNGLVTVPGATTPGVANLDGEIYEELYAGALATVTELVPPLSIRHTPSVPSGSPYFSYNGVYYLKKDLIGRTFKMTRGDFADCLVKIEKIAKVNFTAKVLTQSPHMKSNSPGSYQRRIYQQAERGVLFRFPMDFLAVVLD